jgi:enoyl-CoA hydratase
MNALTHAMIRAYQPQLDAWAVDDSVAAVVIRGTGDKAFCAGGDVLEVYHAGKKGDGTIQAFFREEYTLNRTIFRYPKPYIALIDGITMGGGVGLSVHGSHRIVGERSTFAMPETAIGLFPDVGGSYFLPRLPHRCGLYLALTGARIKAADCLALGIATHYLPSARVAELVEILAAAADWRAPEATVAAALEDLAGDPGPAPLAEHFATIDRAFAGDSVEAILESLHAEGGDWAVKQAAVIEKRSPTSVKIAFAQYHRARGLDFEDCMTLEYRLIQACLAGPDFYEGIRSLLIDKDHAPQWRPASLREVSDEMVAGCFAPLGSDDLRFPAQR